MQQSTASTQQRTARAPHHGRDGASASRHKHQPISRHTGSGATAAGYTLVHRGRQLRFGPVAFWICVGTVVIMAGWSITTATYFAFSNDVIKGVVARQAEQQYAYEDRIAELRAQIDRTMSRQLLDQEQFERKLDELMRREATLESHASALNSVADTSATGSIKPTIDSGAKPSPIGDALLRPQPLDRQQSYAPGKQSNLTDTNITAKLSSIEASLDRVDHRQINALAQMQDRYEGKARKLQGFLAELGLKLDGAPAAAIGGPFVPVRLSAGGQNFDRAVTAVSIARSYADKLGATLANVPLRTPVTGEIDETSPFGVRVDPFQHVAAMHTGIDFRGEMGEPIHATASGTVTVAGWSGGYGNMVEVNHGNGLATRYGHLSRIDVAVGQTVRLGDVVGRLGSTGRSTGPHVHYETRVNGEAVNPAKFLDVGNKLFSGS